MIMLTRSSERFFNPMRFTGSKSSQINSDFFNHFRCLKWDERRNQTLMQSIVHKMPYISINYLDWNYSINLEKKFFMNDGGKGSGWGGSNANVAKNIYGRITQFESWKYQVRRGQLHLSSEIWNYASANSFFILKLQSMSPIGHVILYNITW